MGHSEWVHWTLAGDIASFYAAPALARLGGGERARSRPTRASRSTRRRSRARAASIADAQHTPAPMTALWDRQQAFIEEFCA